MAETAEATVVFGVLNETSEHESRVALTPDIVTRLRKSGVNCLIESGAGVASHYVDEDYSLRRMRSGGLRKPSTRTIQTCSTPMKIS